MSDGNKATPPCVWINVLEATECDHPVARSSAKEVLAYIDGQEHVILDFKGIVDIGPSFADEIFRVYAEANPGVDLNYISTCGDAQYRIDRSNIVRDALKFYADFETYETKGHPQIDADQMPIKKDWGRLARTVLGIAERK